MELNVKTKDLENEAIRLVIKLSLSISRFVDAIAQCEKTEKCSVTFARILAVSLVNVSSTTIARLL